MLVTTRDLILVLQALLYQRWIASVEVSIRRRGTDMFAGRQPSKQNASQFSFKTLPRLPSAVLCLGSVILPLHVPDPLADRQV